MKYPKGLYNYMFNAPYISSNHTHNRKPPLHQIAREKIIKVEKYINIIS